jgi:hypothetical protein
LCHAQQLLDVGRYVAGRRQIGRHCKHHHLHHHQPGDQHAQQVDAAPAHRRHRVGAGAVSRLADRLVDLRFVHQRGVERGVGAAPGEIDMHIGHPGHALDAMLDQKRAGGTHHAVHLDLRALERRIGSHWPRQRIGHHLIKRGTVAAARLGQVQLLGDERATEATVRLPRRPQRAPLDLEPGQRIATVVADKGSGRGVAASYFGLAQGRRGRHRRVREPGQRTQSDAGHRPRRRKRSRKEKGGDRRNTARAAAATLPTVRGTPPPRRRP